MTKIARKRQQIFGDGAGIDQIAKFGSLAAGVPAFTTDPDTIQTLANFVEGWFSAVIGGNSPAIEDMNAVCYLYAYQLAYIFQEGIPEYQASTQYYIGSVVQLTDLTSGIPHVYVAIADNFSNSPPIDGGFLNDTHWRDITSGIITTPINPAITPSTGLTLSNLTYLVNTANGASSFTLPGTGNRKDICFTFKDTAGLADLFPITIVRAASEKIENLAASYVCDAPYGTWRFICDGTNWFLAD